MTNLHAARSLTPFTQQQSRLPPSSSPLEHQRRPLSNVLTPSPRAPLLHPLPNSPSPFPPSSIPKIDGQGQSRLRTTATRTDDDEGCRLEDGGGAGVRTTGAYDGADLGRWGPPAVLAKDDGGVRLRHDGDVALDDSDAAIAPAMG
jgi:hypothetical protein